MRYEEWRVNVSRLVTLSQSLHPGVQRRPEQCQHCECCPVPGAVEAAGGGGCHTHSTGEHTEAQRAFAQVSELLNSRFGF